MLQFLSSRRFRDCDGNSRRNFLKVGALGLGGLTLPALLQARAEASAEGRTVKDTAVVWLWLGGGATHVETFDPKMTAPSEYRSVTGEATTNVPGISIGGTLPRMAQVVDKMAFVRSFAHTNSGHGGGTHYVMTGYDNRVVDNGGVPSRPSMGSILSRVRGSSHPVSWNADVCARRFHRFRRVPHSWGQLMVRSIRMARLAKACRWHCQKIG